MTSAVYLQHHSTPWSETQARESLSICRNGLADSSVHLDRVLHAVIITDGVRERNGKAVDLANFAEIAIIIDPSQIDDAPSTGGRQTLDWAPVGWETWLAYSF